MNVSMAGHIVELAKEQELRVQYGNQGRIDFLERFTWERERGELRKLLWSKINHHPQTSEVAVNNAHGLI
jgi:glycosyltransferase involved in cell wall biosynthesis